MAAPSPCFDRGQRVAYILGDVFQLSSTDAAYVSGVRAEAYRQRLSRARLRVREFIEANCGLASDAAPCGCDRRVRAAVRTGTVDAQHLLFAQRDRVGAAVREMERLHDAASLMRSHPDYAAPGAVKAHVRHALAAGRSVLLDDQGA